MHEIVVDNLPEFFPNSSRILAEPGSKLTHNFKTVIANFLSNCSGFYCFLKTKLSPI